MPKKVKDYLKESAFYAITALIVIGGMVTIAEWIIGDIIEGASIGSLLIHSVGVFIAGFILLIVLHRPETKT